MEARRGDILAAVREVETGAGVVVLTDMFGGTPSNLAISCMDGRNVEVIAGINLPMLIKLASVRPTPAPGSRRDAGAGGRPEIHQRRQPGPCGEMTAMSEANGAVSRELAIVNKRGLHARASAKFVQTVKQFGAEITVSRAGETVAGTSIMGLMMLGAGIGTTIQIEAEGEDAHAAVEALAALVADKFGEEE